MGQQTERLAEEHHIGRGELDEIALMSQRRATEATQKGWFKREIVPIEVKTRTGTQVVDTDEGVRASNTMERLALCVPRFSEEGS